MTRLLIFAGPVTYYSDVLCSYSVDSDHVVMSCVASVDSDHVVMSCVVTVLTVVM